MGCDIHTYVEKKVDGKWMPVIGQSPYDSYQTLAGFAYSGRNYGLFGVLAEVRSEGPPIDQERGMPDDVCEEIQAACDAWDSDGHTHSYYYLSELQAVDPKVFRNVHANSFVDDTIPLLEAIAEGDPDSVRFVFWFDN
jgi:hypothetical protein